MLLRSLLSENRDPVLQVGRPDVSDQTPLEPAYQSGFEAGNLLRCAIRGHDYLPAGLVQGIERVEELFLCHFLPL